MKNAAAALLLVLAACAQPQAAQRPVSLPNAPITMLDGRTVALRRYVGHPLWINVFATWCPPCIAEIPEIERRYEQNEPRGLIVLGVDRQESAGTVVAFVKKHYVQYPVATDDGTAAQALRVGTLPVSVFVDASGMIREVRTGQMNPSDMDAAIAGIMTEKRAVTTSAGVFALQGGVQRTAAFLRGNRVWMTRPGSRTPIRSYDFDMTKYLHAILISDDFRIFEHIHPILQRDGRFAFERPLPSDRPYYLYVDATPHGIGQQVFRFDLDGAARHQRPALSERDSSRRTGPYTVRLAGALSSGAESPIVIRITKKGKPAGDLHPYLGALAHAVFIDANDLSYLHAHPMPLSPVNPMQDADMNMSEMPALPANATTSPTMMLYVRVTQPGIYKLWLQFRGGNSLHVVSFVLQAH